MKRFDIYYRESVDMQNGRAHWKKLDFKMTNRQAPVNDDQPFSKFPKTPGRLPHFDAVKPFMTFCIRHGAWRPAAVPHVLDERANAPETPSAKNTFPRQMSDVLGVFLL